MLEEDARADNCGSQSEFVEKTIRFYDGYLHTNRASAFLPKVLLDVLEGSLGVYCGRVGKLLFNLAVEHSITNHLLAEDADMKTTPPADAGGVILLLFTSLLTATGSTAGRYTPWDRRWASPRSAAPGCRTPGRTSSPAPGR